MGGMSSINNNAMYCGGNIAMTNDGRITIDGVDIEDYDFGDSNTVYMYMDRNGKMINGGGGKKNRTDGNANNGTTTTTTTTTATTSNTSPNKT